MKWLLIWRTTCSSGNIFKASIRRLHKLRITQCFRASTAPTFVIGILNYSSTHIYHIFFSQIFCIIQASVTFTLTQAQIPLTDRTLEFLYQLLHSNWMPVSYLSLSLSFLQKKALVCGTAVIHLSYTLEQVLRRTAIIQLSALVLAVNL